MKRMRLLVQFEIQLFCERVRGTRKTYCIYIRPHELINDIQYEYWYQYIPVFKQKLAYKVTCLELIWEGQYDAHT